MESMKQATFYGNGVMQIEEAPEPSPREGEVKIAIAYCCICDSDVVMFYGPVFQEGAHPLVGIEPPFPMGHELSGVVVECGEGVASVNVGDRVSVQPVISCGVCPSCRANSSNLCSMRGMMGYSAPGGMAEYVCVREQQVYPILPDMSLLDAALVQCSAFAFCGVIDSGLKLSDSCLIVGAGVCGLMTTQAAKAAGAQTIIVSDHSSYRLDAAKKMGATHVVHMPHDDADKIISEATSGIGVDYAFDTAGMENTLDQCISAIRPNGTAMVVVNDYDFNETYSFNCTKFWSKQATIRCAYSAYTDRYAEMVELARRKVMDASPLITKTIPLDNALYGFLAFESDPNQLKIVIKVRDLEQ